MYVCMYIYIYIICELGLLHFVSSVVLCMSRSGIRLPP